MRHVLRLLVDCVFLFALGTVTHMAAGAFTWHAAVVMVLAGVYGAACFFDGVTL